VLGYINARVVTAKSLSVVTATAVTSIALTAAPIMPALPLYAERPNATAQRAVVGTIMRIGSVDFGRVNEKK
jgi:hypothetical protein